jgi:sec-independent protein translocase protein TatB
MPDTLILMVLALVVLGPRRLPQLGRQIGKLMYEFRKASNDFKFQMEEELRNAEEADRRKKEEERQRALAAMPPAPQLEQSTSAVAAESGLSAPESSATDPVSTTPASPASTPDASENLYPYESGYTETDLTFKTERPIESSSSPEPEAAAPVTDAVPRIMPPSIGETVAAEPPTRQSPVPEPAAPNSMNPAGSATESVVPEDERSEPATHHG